jgi:molybdopterin-guanine dinucleotide biosynthesis protein A
VRDQIIISILTGGKSSRMEFQNKSFLKIHNKTFIELLLDQLKILGYEIVINVNDDERNI